MPTTLPTPPIAFVPLAPSSHAPTPALLPGQTAANDAHDDSAFAALVGHPGVGRSIRNRVRYQMRAKFLNLSPVEQQDIIAAVYASLWNRRTDRDPATTLPRMRGLARRIVDGKIVDFLRHRDAANEDRVDAPNEHEVDPAEGSPEDVPNFIEQLGPAYPMTPERSLLAKEQLRYLNEMGAKLGITDDDIEVMYAMTFDRLGSDRATWEELAAERKTTPQGLRKRIERLQDAIKSGWDMRMKRPLVLTLILLAMLLLYALAALGPARQTPPPEPAPLPTVHELAPPAPKPIPKEAPATVLEDYRKGTLRKN